MEMYRICLMNGTNGHIFVSPIRQFSNSDPTSTACLTDGRAVFVEIFWDGVQKFTEQGNIHFEIIVRIAVLPVQDTFCEMRQIYLNTVNTWSRVVSGRSSVQRGSDVRIIRIHCEKWKTVLLSTADTWQRPELSLSQWPVRGTKWPFAVESEEGNVGDVQKIKLQEKP